VNNSPSFVKELQVGQQHQVTVQAHQKSHIFSTNVQRKPLQPRLWFPLFVHITDNKTESDVFLNLQLLVSRRAKPIVCIFGVLIYCQFSRHA
jgi:hypothetical protein